MIAKAKTRFLRVAPRKLRGVARELRGMPVAQAEAFLKSVPRRAAKPLTQTLACAVANATRDGGWRREDLVVRRVLADGGPAIKRYRAAAMGRAVRVVKRTSHLTIELDADKETKRGT